MPATIVTDVHSLRDITARSSSARVLDLHALALEAADLPDHANRPIFTHPVLNRTIIVKHHPRPGEFDDRPDRRAVTTKVIFPFDPNDLQLGGQYILVDRTGFPEQFDHQLDYRVGDRTRDLAVIELIDSLPTLDPFLLREALIANKFDVAPCYFRLSPTDQSEMLGFVSEQVSTLIDLCFAGPGAEMQADKAKRLSELLLSGGDGPELDPLRAALHLAPEQFAEAVFCWKAVLYYRWRSRGLAPEVKATRKAIGNVDLGRFEDHTAPFVAQALGRIESMIGECERRIAQMFKIYDEVFDALAEDRSPEPFRRMLVDGPRVFARMGERMGRLEQVVSFWRHQFPDQRIRQAPTEAIVEGLRNILNALSIQSGHDGGRRSTARAWDDPSDGAARRQSRGPMFRRAG
ncbi:MAG TPA: hypothetical protein VME40_12925 [Caulobacteraceae bacterium]|nr:hypothetical protein [Caulobacteraceae bacterium]